MKHSGLLGIRLTAGVVAFGLVGAAWSDPRQVVDGATLTELANGTLVAYRTNPAAATQVHYAHQAGLVASDCLSLDTRRLAANATMPVLTNRCAYPVAVSYCFDGSPDRESACDAVGHRKMESRRIDPGAVLPLKREAAAADQVIWVACRNLDGSVFSSLIQDGTRGECLGAETAAQSPGELPLLAGSK